MAGYLAELKGFFDGSADLLIVGGDDMAADRRQVMDQLQGGILV